MYFLEYEKQLTTLKQHNFFGKKDIMRKKTFNGSKMANLNLSSGCNENEN